MNHIAKIFMNGQSQAVRLPKEYRFKSDTVYVRKNAQGEVVLSEKPRTWADYFSQFADDQPEADFMANRDDAPAVERDLF